MTVTELIAGSAAVFVAAFLFGLSLSYVLDKLFP